MIAKDTAEKVMKAPLIAPENVALKVKTPTCAPLYTVIYFLSPSGTVIG